MNEAEAERIAVALRSANALIFDCDGTLVDSAPVYAKAWAAGFASAGRTMAEAWYRDRNGLSEEVLMTAFEAANSLVLDRREVLARMRRAYAEHIGALAEVPMVADVASKMAGKLPMAVASGGPRDLVLVSLERLGLSTLFDTVVTLDDVGRPKPAPDLFVEAARRLGADAERCLVFEDSDPGVAAAKAARMGVIDVRHLAMAKD